MGFYIKSNEIKKQNVENNWIVKINLFLLKNDYFFPLIFILSDKKIITKIFMRLHYSIFCNFLSKKKHFYFFICLFVFYLLSEFIKNKKKKLYIFLIFQIFIKYKTNNY